MSVNYNSLKSLKGTSIGTIVPWAGDLTTIPKGWVKCDGSTKEVEDYPLLYQIIGNRYGGTTNDTFALPSINNSGIVDYHQNHQNISGISMPDNFKNQINNVNDVPNTYSLSPSSNIDLKVGLSPINIISATISGQTLNNPSFTDSVYIAGRLLGDDHMAAHSHQGTVGDTVSTPNQWVEQCQSGTYQDCFLNCTTLYPVGPCCDDDCDDITFYRVEANNPEDVRHGLRKGDRQGGLSLLFGLTGATGVDFARTNSPRNYILPSEDPVSSNNASGAYNTTLDQNAVDFINSGNVYHSAHDHEPMSYDITIGSMKVPATYNINTVGVGNVTPVNDAIRNIATIEANIETACCNIQYIIRAY